MTEVSNLIAINKGDNHVTLIIDKKSLLEENNNLATFTYQENAKIEHTERERKLKKPKTEHKIKLRRRNLKSKMKEEEVCVIVLKFNKIDDQKTIEHYTLPNFLCIDINKSDIQEFNENKGNNKVQTDSDNDLFNNSESTESPIK